MDGCVMGHLISRNQNILTEGAGMSISEFGCRDDPTVIFLATMMVSGTDLHDLMQPHFRGDHHIIAPDQGRHGNT